MDIVASPLDDVLEFAALLDQLAQLILGYLGLPLDNPLTVIAFLGVFGVLLLLRGYLVLNTGVLVITLGLGVSYLDYLVATSSDPSAINQTLVLIGVTISLLFLVDTIKFYLVGTLISVYVITGIIGPLIGITNLTILMPLGIAAGLLISSIVNDPLENLFDDINSFLTSGLGVFFLLGVVVIAFGAQDITLGFTESCGLLLFLLAPVLWYTSVQRTHRQQQAETSLLPADPSAATRKIRFPVKTALVIVLTVLLTLLNGVPNAGEVNQVWISEPIDSFVAGFNDYKDKLTADSNNHYFVTLDEPLALYDCPSYDCEADIEARSDYRLVLLDYPPTPDESGARLWIETPYHFRVFFVPVAALAADAIEAPVSQQAATE